MGRVLAWQPRNRQSQPTAVAVHLPQIWAMVKGEKEIGCFVEDTGPCCNICWRVNGQWVFRSVFADGSEAAAAARQKYEELKAAGWQPASVQNASCSPK
jgi:hypothetical protein